MIVHGAPKLFKLKKCVVNVPYGGLGIVAVCTRSNGLARGLIVNAFNELRRFAKIDQRCNNRIIGSNCPDLDKGEEFEAMQHLTRVQLMAEVRAAREDDAE